MDLSAALDIVDHALLIDVANYIVITVSTVFISMGLTSADLSLKECLDKMS